MNVNKAELIQSLKGVKKYTSVNDSLVEASSVVKQLRSNISKVDNSKLLSDIKDNFKESLTEGISIDKVWRPQKTDMKSIMDRVLVESTYEQQNNPNAMRLNLQSIVLDKSHAKFGITRNGVNALVELLYPNVNDKITIKISVKGADDTLVEVGLEDQPYLTDLGVYILKLVDETIANSEEHLSLVSANTDQSTLYLDNKSGGMTGYPPIWEADNSKLSSLMALVEQEEDDEDLEADIGGVEDVTGVQGDGFTQEDFAIDAGSAVDTGDFTSDFGGDFGGTEDIGDVNASDDGQVEGEPEGDVEWSTFRDKTDWLQSSLDTMQELTSTSIAQKMQQGNGVVLTSDEIMNGSVGLKNDMPVDIVDKFLNVYPELDNIEITETNLDLIEEKLSLDDGQFDAWLQQKLPEFTGQEEVSDVLDNEMFQEFEPMGGEEVDEDIDAAPSESFGEFMDDLSVEEEKTPEEREAEAEVDLSEIPELPNI